MKIELDVHTHTIASGHAFSTLQEMAQAAAGKGLKVLGYNGTLARYSRYLPSYLF